MSIQLSNVGPVNFPSRTYIDEANNVVHVEFRGHLTRAEVILGNVGVTAHAWARLSDGDTYSKDFGEMLATNRATQRALRKYERILRRGVDAG